MKNTMWSYLSSSKQIFIKSVESSHYHQPERDENRTKQVLEYKWSPTIFTRDQHNVSRHGGMSNQYVSKKETISYPSMNVYNVRINYYIKDGEDNLVLYLSDETRVKEILEKLKNLSKITIISYPWGYFEIPEIGYVSTEDIIRMQLYMLLGGLVLIPVIIGFQKLI